MQSPKSTKPGDCSDTVTIPNKKPPEKIPEEPSKKRLFGSFRESADFSFSLPAKRSPKPHTQSEEIIGMLKLEAGGLCKKNKNELKEVRLINKNGISYTSADNFKQNIIIATHKNAVRNSTKAKPGGRMPISVKDTIKREYGISEE